MTMIETDMESCGTSHNIIPYMRLWASMFALMVRDYKSKRPSLEHAQAVAWFSNDSKAPGSFIWVCNLFGYKPANVLLRLEEYHVD